MGAIKGNKQNKKAYRHKALNYCHTQMHNCARNDRGNASGNVRTRSRRDCRGHFSVTATMIASAMRAQCSRVWQ